MKRVRVPLRYPAPEAFDGLAQATCQGGSFAVESVAAFAWNGWQASPGISGNLGLEYAAKPPQRGALKWARFPVLRIAALRNPAQVERLIDRNHELFTEQSLERLQRVGMPQEAALWQRGFAEHWLPLRPVRRSGPMSIPLPPLIAIGFVGVE